MAMLELATGDSPKMLISTVELEAPSRPYTIETLGRLRAELQPARLFFLMGADSFADVTSWREYEAILSEYDVVVVTRPGYPGRDACDGDQNGEEAVGALAPQLRRRIVDLRGGAYPSDEDLKSPRVYLTDYVSIDVSATGIRKAVEQGRSIDGLVPPPVAAYVEKYRLYQKS
jgi:nicotinate-nucleotide adenylyltransferase